MMRFIKLIFIILVLGLAGLSGYAYLADLTPVQTEVRVPVVLDAD